MTETRKGEIYILGSAITWGFFPVFAVLSYKTLPPLFSLSFSFFIAALFFAGLVTVKKEWQGLRNKQVWKHLSWIILCNAILYHSLYYVGLKHSTPGNASLIALTEVFAAFLLFQGWHKEAMTKAHIVGGVLMLAGSSVILSRNVSGFSSGDWLIVLAAFISPFGNYHQQKARKLIGAAPLLFARSIVSVPFVMLLGLSLGEHFSFNQLPPSLWFLLFSGLISFGISKIFWIEGIHRINVTKSNTIASLSAAFTILFAWAILAQTPTLRQVLALPLLMLGLYLITKKE